MIHNNPYLQRHSAAHYRPSQSMFGKIFDFALKIKETQEHLCYYGKIINRLRITQMDI